MKWRETASNREFVSRLKMELRWRRPVGMALVVISLLLAGVSGMLIHRLLAGTFQMVPGRLEQIAFELGLTIGFILSQVALNALHLMMTGLAFCHLGRTERLLIEYQQRFDELGELPD